MNKDIIEEWKRAIDFISRDGCDCTFIKNNVRFFTSDTEYVCEFDAINSIK